MLSILTSACPAPTRTEVKREDALKSLRPTPEAVVLFPTHRDSAGGNEADFVRCLKANLEKQFSHRVKIIDTELFQDYMFPWFEVQYAPETVEELNRLLSKPLVRERIASLGVRYLINIARHSDSDGGGPGIICGGGYGGAGCLGAFWEDKTHEVYAVIFDIIKGVHSGSLSASTSGRSFGFAFIVPIVFLAQTETEGCKALAAELGQLLVGTTESE